MPPIALLLFTEQERADLTRLKGEMEDQLKQERRNIYEIARRLIEVRDRGLWQIEGSKDFYQWVESRLDVKQRQAKTYIAVGKLKRQRVVDSKLTLEKLEVLSGSPDELKDVVEEVGGQEVEGQKVTLKALRAGRNAGVQVLRNQATGAQEPSEQERIQAAREEVKRVALEESAGTRPDSAEQVADKAEKAALLQQSRVVDLWRRWESGEKIDVERVRSLADITAQTADKLHGLLEFIGEEQEPAPGAVDCTPAAPGPPPKAEPVQSAVDCTPAAPEPAPKAEPVQSAVDCTPAAPAAPERVPVATTTTDAHEHEHGAATADPPVQADWKPLDQAALHALNEPERITLGIILYLMVNGTESFAQNEQELREMEAPFERNGPLPAGLFGAWLERLGDPDSITRRLWTLRFYRGFNLPYYRSHLKKLSEQDLPQQVRDLVQVELARLEERRRRLKQRRRAEAGPEDQDLQWLASPEGVVYGMAP